MKELTMLPIHQLHPHPDNPRRELGDLTELSESIKANGILQNLTVVPCENGYRIIIGHRRLAAAKLAGLDSAPCAVVEMDEREQMQTMLVENMQRADLTVYEQALGFQLMLDLGATVEEVAEKSGFSVTTVKRRVKMMELDRDKLREVSNRQITLEQFDELGQIEDLAQRNKVLECIGTPEFARVCTNALNEQKAKRNIPKIRAWLKKHGLMKIEQAKSYSSAYEIVNGYVRFCDWTEKTGESLVKQKEQLFYVWYPSYMSICRKRPKAEKQEKTPEQIEEETAIREANRTLNAAYALAYDLRKKFVERVKLTRKNRETVIYGGVLAGAMHSMCYHPADKDMFKDFFSTTAPSYGEESERQVFTWLSGVEEKDLPKLVFALFGDSGKSPLLSAKNDWPQYRYNAPLALVYFWLVSLGYQMSEEEKRLVDGTHAAFRAREDFKAALKKGEPRQ